MSSVRCDPHEVILDLRLPIFDCQGRRFIIDNDGTNLFCRKSLTEATLRWAVEQCPASVTTYMVCPNYCGKFMYPCSVGEMVPRDRAPGLVAAVERGEDPFGMFLDHLRQAGKEVFVTYRMNDVHGADDPDHPGTAEFKKRHPDFVVDAEAVQRGGGNWMAHCLDYARPEVREYILSSLSDMAGRYDVDGFQLDWMRFPRHLSGRPGDEIWAKRDALTEFIASVRRMLDDLGADRGRRISLAVRVPTWPEGCRALGADVAEWGRRNLMDFITPAPFLSCDFKIPVEAFRTMLSENPIPIYAGTDLNHSGRCHTPESYRAWASSMYDQGADGLNVFNFPCWTEYLGEQPYDWIADLDDPEQLRDRPALYTLIGNYHRVPQIDQPTPLPVAVEPGEAAELVLGLPGAALPASRALLLIAVDGEVDVSVNGIRLNNPRKAPSGNIFLAFLDRNNLDREPPAAHCRLFVVAPESLQARANILQLKNPGNETCMIGRLDLGLWY